MAFHRASHGSSGTRCGGPPACSGPGFCSTSPHVGNASPLPPPCRRCRSFSCSGGGFGPGFSSTSPHVRIMSPLPVAGGSGSAHCGIQASKCRHICHVSRKRRDSPHTPHTAVTNGPLSPRRPVSGPLLPGHVVSTASMVNALQARSASCQFSVVADAGPCSGPGLLSTSPHVSRA